MKLKRTLALLTVFCALLSQLALGAGGFNDVPANSWAIDDIAAADAAGIMNGRGGGIFGYGDSITRSEFAAMLIRLMGWQKSDIIKSPYDDVKDSEWYFDSVNTLWERGVERNKSFRPLDNITRREMAVMLVKALGYDNLAKSENGSAFSDVTHDGGYISVAYRLGIIKGTGGSQFDPEGSATREQGAAMMMRVYNKLYSKIDELHGFYAISSWSQRDLACQMDTVSFGWARLEYDGNVRLNQTAQGGNDWKIPEGYTDALRLMDENGVKKHLAVTMTDRDDSTAILTDENNRSQAIAEIVSASNEFDGVTIDFEGLRGNELKNALNSFVKELKSALNGKTLYITVHPVLTDGEYYDGYDYRTLGEVCDRVILMAHDYGAGSLPPSLLNTDFIATPVSPFYEVYTALKAVTDEKTGVADINKVELALSVTNTEAWNVKDRKIIDPTPIHPSMDTVQKRLGQADTEIIYSDTYRNPYAWYKTDGGEDILIWYEDSRSIGDKIDLAKMFGVNNISLWRLGAIPNGNKDTYMDVWQTVKDR